MGTATVGLAPPASAHAQDGVCDPDELCLYSGRDFTGSVVDYGGRYEQPSYAFESFVDGPVLNDNVESIWNRSWYVYEFYADKNYRGKKMTVYQFEERTRLPISLDENISSHRAVGS
jgi:hypothetical protein